jgi:hypothetical protein
MPDITGEGGALKMRKETGTVKDIAEFFYDMKLAGSPLQCDEGDGTCETMEYALSVLGEAKSRLISRLPSLDIARNLTLLHIKLPIS